MRSHQQRDKHPIARQIDKKPTAARVKSSDLAIDLEKPRNCPIDYNPRMASSGQGSEQARQAPDIRLVVDTIPTLAWSARPDGSAEFFA
jgi:hypothetical protein